jgi:hypothetical protein
MKNCFSVDLVAQIKRCRHVGGPFRFAFGQFLSGSHAESRQIRINGFLMQKLKNVHVSFIAVVAQTLLGISIKLICESME